MWNASLRATPSLSSHYRVSRKKKINATSADCLPLGVWEDGVLVYTVCSYKFKAYQLRLRVSSSTYSTKDIIYSPLVVFVMGWWFIIPIIVFNISFKYSSGQKKKTKVIDNNLDPVWNEVQCSQNNMKRVTQINGSF